MARFFGILKKKCIKHNYKCPEIKFICHCCCTKHTKYGTRSTENRIAGLVGSISHIAPKYSNFEHALWAFRTI
jgi:galactokinase